MTLPEIMDLISMGESESLEVKRSTGQRTDAMKAVCGMLNGSGGHVLFGVTDKGNPVGQQVSTRTGDTACPLSWTGSVVLTFFQREIATDQKESV